MAIRFRNVTTLRACLRCIGGFYYNDRNTSEGRLILNKLPQLSKGPLSKSLSFGPSNRWPEAHKVFQGDSPLAVFGLGDDSFAYRVIRNLFKTPVFTGKFFKMALGVFSCFFLKFLFEFRPMFSYLINMLARINLAIRSRGNIDHAEINAKRPLWSKRRAIRDFDTNTKKELVFMQDKVSLAPDHPAMKLGIATIDNGDFETAIHTQNADAVEPKSQNPRIIDQGGVLPESSGYTLIGTIGLDGLPNGTDSELSAESEFFPNLKIAKLQEHWTTTGEDKERHAACQIYGCGRIR